MTINSRARGLKISENTLRYPYFLVLKFQLDRTIFDLLFGVIFKTGKLICPPLYFTDENIDEAVTLIKRILSMSDTEFEKFMQKRAIVSTLKVQNIGFCGLCQYANKLSQGGVKPKLFTGTQLYDKYFKTSDGLSQCEY